MVKDGHRLNCYLMLSPSCEPPQPTTENLRPGETSVPYPHEGGILK